MRAAVLNQLKPTAPKLVTNDRGFSVWGAVKLKHVARTDSGYYLAMLESSAEGLSIGKVREKLQKYGYNEIAHEQAPGWLRQLGQAFINPFIGILVAIAGIALLTDVLLAQPGEHDVKTVIVVGVMVVLSALLRFWQEFRSNQAAEQLKN